MILQALVKHYEMLLKQGKVTPKGWCQAKVSYAINLHEDGRIKGIISLKREEERGKKTILVPSVRRVPQMVTRSSGVAANFLCDNSKYMLGIDVQGSGKRILECFETAKEKHLKILKDVDSKMAETVRAFFLSWNPETAKNDPKIQEMWEDVTDGGNLIFVMDTKEAQDDEAICHAWQSWQQEKEEVYTGTCLVTGEKEEITQCH